MAIDIQPNDILWLFYCKKFVLEGKEIQEPRNLCFYVRMAMKGFFLWLSLEAKLSVILRTALAAFAMLVVTIGSLHVIPINAFTTILVVALVVLSLLLFATIATMMLAAFDRIYCLIEKQAVWFALLVAFFFLGYSVVESVSQGVLLSKMFDVIHEIRLVVLMAIVTWVFILAFLLVGVVISGWNSFRYFKQTLRLLQTMLAYLKTKSHVCPLVNPPEGFNLKK